VNEPFGDNGTQRPPLTPGLFVEASISGKPIQQSVELPATALRGDNTVLLVNENSRLERLPIELLRREQDRVWVRGIDAGMQVVAEQSSVLAAGAAIEVAETRTPSG
jgi:multidrug efflux pump subunit AcrA (membrane-fusion protein)